MTLEKKKLNEFLKVAKKLTAKNALDILSNITITFYQNTVTFKATNLKIYLSLKLEDNNPNCGRYAEAVTVIVPFNFVDDAVKSNKNKDFTIKHTYPLTINDLSYEDSDNLITLDKYPDFPENTELVIATGEISNWDALQHITKYQSDDETRYFMGGVCFEFEEGNLQAIATDGRKLCYSNSFDLGTHELTENLDEEKSVIVPSLEMFAKFPTRKFILTDRVFTLHDDSFTITILRIDGKFPNWKRIVPENDSLTKLDINMENFRQFKKDFVLHCKMNDLKISKRGNDAFADFEKDSFRVQKEDGTVIHSQKVIDSLDASDEHVFALIFNTMITTIPDNDTVEWFYKGKDNALKLIDSELKVTSIVMPRKRSDEE